MVPSNQRALFRKSRSRAVLHVRILSPPISRRPGWRTMDERARPGWLTSLVSRRAVLATGAAGLAAPVAMTLGVAAPYESATAQTGTVRKVTIYAEALPGNLYGYGLAPGQATIPGPVLEIYE